MAPSAALAVCPNSGLADFYLKNGGTDKVKIHMFTLLRKAWPSAPRDLRNQTENCRLETEGFDYRIST